MVKKKVLFTLVLLHRLEVKLIGFEGTRNTQRQTNGSRYLHIIVKVHTVSLFGRHHRRRRRRQRQRQRATITALQIRLILSWLLHFIKIN